MKTITIALALALSACGGTAQDPPQSSNGEADPFTIIGWCDQQQAGLLSSPPGPVTREQCDAICGPLLAEFADSGKSPLVAGEFCTTAWNF